VAFVRLLCGCVVVMLTTGAAWATGPSVPAAGTVGVSSTGVRELVRQVSLEHGLDPKLVDAVVRVESGYDPGAVSHRGAMGLMQLMPETAIRLGVADPFDPEQNVRGGVREFARLVDVYRGNLQYALAAYNAGEGAVARYRGVPPYNETRNYVSQILSIYTGRPYRVSGSYRTVPVRMATDPSTGRTIITNQPAGQGASGVSLQRSGTGSGPLKGGFGAFGR
jgi:soluble lytic murein transglycosylase-like protein